MMGAVLEDVVDVLACPVCRAGLAVRPGVLRCAGGHAFDVARQGYVSLLTGSRVPGTADTAAMVAARDAFLGAGHYAPLVDRLAGVVPPGGVVLDAGAGTGYYLARVLRGTARGVALDVSRHALRRAARAHPRIGAVAADVWGRLPLRDAAAETVINVFAPRNGPEFARVLRPGGRLVVVTPAPDHLSPLVDRLGLLSVDADKQRRVEDSLGRDFTETERSRVRFTMDLDRDAAAAVAGMGPSARHDRDAPGDRMAAIPGRVTVTASFSLSIFEHHPRSRALT